MRRGSTEFQTRSRTVLAIALTFNTGLTDAIGFIGLGGAFTSVMTGNMVLLGLSAGTLDRNLAVLTTAAILCYIGGTAFGARLAGQHGGSDAVWPKRVTTGIAVELCVLTVFAVGWESAAAKPSTGWQLVLLMINAAALGIQAASVNRLAVPGLSTTFLTGTLTRVIIHVTAGRPIRDEARSVGTLSALIIGALVGGILTKFAPLAAPVAQLVCVGAVLAAARTIFGDRRRRPVLRKKGSRAAI